MNKQKNNKLKLKIIFFMIILFIGIIVSFLLSTLLQLFLSSSILNASMGFFFFGMAYWKFVETIYPKFIKKWCKK